jgi:assimilatory nitrate reductase catalytic subunit
VFGGGGLTNEKAYQLGKFARVALRHQRRSTTTAASACRRRPARQPAFGVDRGLPFPLETSSRPTSSCWSAATSPRRCRPAARTSTAPRAGGKLVVIDPRRTPTADRADAAPAAAAGHRPRARQLGCCTCAIAEGLVDEEYVARAPPASTTCAASPPGGPSGSSGSPASRSRPRARLRCSAAAEKVDHPDRPRRRAAQRRAPTPCSPGSTSRSRSGCPASPYSGYGCLTGQGNGQGGREHGQKADQLPGYRMIDDPGRPRARRRRVGRRPDDLPGPGRSAYELLDALGTDGGPRRCWCFGSNIVVSAPNANGCQPERLDAPRPARRRDFVLSETARSPTSSCPGHAVGRGDRHDDQPRGRVILRRKALDPPAGVRSDLE